jgi:hypothetical protein
LDSFSNQKNNPQISLMTPTETFTNGIRARCAQHRSALGAEEFAVQLTVELNQTDKQRKLP